MLTHQAWLRLQTISFLDNISSLCFEHYGDLLPHRELVLCRFSCSLDIIRLDNAGLSPLRPCHLWWNAVLRAPRSLHAELIVPGRHQILIRDAHPTVISLLSAFCMLWPHSA